MTRRLKLIHRACQHRDALSAFLAAVALASLPMAAHAGLPDIAGKANAIAAWLIGAGLAVMTGAVVWAGFRVLFQGADFRSLSNLLWGGLLIGGAAIFAAFFLG
ncbi:TrbC/VirB2 family protein [Azohydromonas australica]|uniref:TrbC/VirB2 family protein n=1 Tax=Azohydromonas australica TaxID=364039 RepID=UPI0003FECAEB|nr:TrbC/VirB2 family protein [Azohydromonas australica]